MQSVAFFRNLNLGHRGSPGRAALLAAFASAGATAVRSFQTNGTVIFCSPAPVCTTRAVVPLLADSGYADAVLVRRRRWLLELADRLTDAPERSEVTLFDSRTAPPSPPWRPDSGRITLLAADRSHAVFVNDRPRTAFGTPTIERLLGVPATSRSTGTLVRLAALLRAEVDGERGLQPPPSGGAAVPGT